tara:strand:+ start:987 stop:1718 length:732 start_codon:yes stop_codon:yes gene_type:complete
MILDLFKSKPTLKELIPNGFVDIHSHILPGIDDGAKNVEESLLLISEMQKLGFSKIIGTPHTYSGVYNNTSESIEKSYKKLGKNITNIELDFASEYMLDNSLIENLRNKNILCLKENYILVEMSYISAPNNLYEIIFEIKTNGFIPVLAHPERYSFFHNNIKEFYKLKKHGCFFQINLLSCTGYYGAQVLIMINNLLKNKIIDFVGSDIHNLNHIKAFEKNVLINRNHIEDLGKCIERNSLFI